MLFLHAPKTGGTWVTVALEAVGISYERIWTRLGAGNRGHPTLLESATFTDRFTFAFVRHPLDLYRSFWADNMRVGWPPNRPFYDLRSDHFPTYVDRILRQHPGFFSEHLEEFTGPPEAQIAFVGRYESLVDDLVRALSLAGEEFDEARLRAIPPANRNDYARHHATYDRALADRVVESEQQAIQRWYAGDPRPARVLESN
jgi:hypothetical protein